jgi:hypothetical protein
MAIQIGKYKRPGIFIEEIDKTIITSPPVTGPTPNLIMGFSRKGPVNSAVLISNLGELETIFGSLDRQLERKGSYFHRTISKMLEAGPVYAVNLLVTDDALDTVEYQSVSTTSQYKNDIERVNSFRKFFDTTGFWKRDTEAFIDLVSGDINNSQRLLNLVNLGDRYISVFVVKSQVSGFDRALLEWYGSVEKLPPYLYATDLASDYLVDVVVVGGDWSNYQSLSEDPRWLQYFSSTGLKKTELRNFANDRNITTLAYYEGVSLIPYFRDLNGRNIFIETVINRDTDRTGLFCAFNNNLVEADYPKGLIDLIGNSLVSDNLLSNPPSLDETYYQSLDKNDQREDGELRINFLSYDQQITETVSFTNRVLDRAGNVTALFGSNSALKNNTFTHSFNDNGLVKGGVVNGPNPDTNLSYVSYPQRTYWHAEGYVNDLYRVGGFTTTTQSVTLTYKVAGTGSNDNGYAVIGGTRIELAGTYSVVLSALDYPQNKTASGTFSYNVAYTINTRGEVLAYRTLAPADGTIAKRPRVPTSDIVLGWGTVSLYGGLFVTFSGQYAPSITDVTIGLTTSTFGNGSDAYKPLIYGTDYQFSTASTPAVPLTTGDFKVEFLNTNSTPNVNDYDQYRRFKLFNNMLTYVNSSTTARGLMLLNPQGDTTKKPLSEVSFRNFSTGTTVNKSFVVSTGLSASDVSSILTNGELVFYKLDDEFLIDYAGFETKNTLPVLTSGSTQSMGVVGRFSSFYSQFDQGNISTGDVFFQNNIYDGVSVQFLQGAGVTPSLAGFNYIVFGVDQTKTYKNQNNNFFNEINDLIGSQAVDEFSVDVDGYKFLIGGALNAGVFTTVYDRGLSVDNGLIAPEGSDGDGTAGTGRAYLLYNYSNGVVNTLDTATTKYYAFEITDNIVDETVTASRIYGYSNTQNDADLADKPLYIRAYTKTDGNLVVNFTDFSLATQSYLGALANTGNSGLATNGSIFVKSQIGNFKQTLEIETPSGWVEKPNVILVRRARYGEVRVGDYLEADYDATLLQADEMPKKLTRILSKRLWSGDGNYVELATDLPIKVRTIGTDKQTTRFTKIDDLVTTYQAISLKGFRLREAQMPDGTDTRQNSILDVVRKGTNLYKALINKEAFDFRYLIDSFGLGLSANSKQNLVDLIGDRLDAFGILNMPSLRQFKNSVNPSFKDASGNVQIEFVAKGGDPESNPNFLYSFGKGKGVTSVGYFLPYVQVDDFGRIIEIPPSAYVGLTFMRKHTSTTTSITPWTIAAGVNNGRIEGILDLEQIFSYSDLEFLNQAQMNPLTFKRNRGFVIETENTAQVLVKSALSLIHVREVLIELERELSRMLLDFQWTFNTPEIRAAIKLQADVICEKYVAQGGLFNYFNKIDEENNTLEIIDNQIGVIDTYVEPIKGMGIIVNNITILRTGAISAGGFINS